VNSRASVTIANVPSARSTTSKPIADGKFLSAELPTSVEVAAPVAVSEARPFSSMEKATIESSLPLSSWLEPALMLATKSELPSGEKRTADGRLSSSRSEPAIGVRVPLSKVYP